MGRPFVIVEIVKKQGHSNQYLYCGKYKVAEIKNQINKKKKEIIGINCVIRPKKIDSDASRKPWQQRLLPQTDGNMTCFK